jgi:hypothetical protein
LVGGGIHRKIARGRHQAHPGGKGHARSIKPDSHQLVGKSRDPVAVLAAIITKL